MFKLQNCTSDALIHPVDSWGKIRQYKWHSCTGEIPTFICGTAYVPIFFVVSEIQGSKLQKLSKKYKFFRIFGPPCRNPLADLKIFASKRASAYPLSIGLHLMMLRQKQKVAVLFTKMSALTPKKCSTPCRWHPPRPSDPKSGEYFWEHSIYPANLVSIAPRVSEIWITQYFPIDLNVKIQPPDPGAPTGRSSQNYLVPVPGVCSTLSRNFTPIAPSCVEISSTVQTNKNKKKQQT